MRVEVKRVDPAARSDFYAVHCDANGAGWCACVAWWVPTWEGWDARTAAENRALRESLFDRGERDGYILHVDGAPVGWCQAAPRDRLEKLARQLRLAPEPSTWAISCFVIAPCWRGRGLARALLEGALADLAARGVRRVEAYPRRGATLPPEDAWTGPLALFLGAGFRIVRDDEARGPVLALDLPRAGSPELSAGLPRRGPPSPT